MESISANLHEFLHCIDTDLTRPQKKFLRNGLIGLLHAGRSVVCRMARHVSDQRTKFLSRLDRPEANLNRPSDFDKIYPNLKQFCLDQQRIHGTTNKRMIEAVRCNPDVKGYCVHALTAGDWIIGAGLLDLFRWTTQAGRQPQNSR